MRRSVRLLVLLAAIAVTGIVGWRATVNEQRRAAVRSAAESSDTMAADTLNALADLRASLYAYVAPGQGHEFWSGRATALLTSIRAGILAVDASATIAGHPLAAQTIDDLDRLQSAELRAREAVSAGQPRFAGDIIFTDVRNRIDGVAAQVAAARRTMARVASSADVGITNEQSLLAGAVLAVWLMTGILLVPLPIANARTLPHTVEHRKADPLDLSLHESPGAIASRATDTSAESAARPAESASKAAAVPNMPAAPPPETPSLPALAALASLCSDLGRVSDVAQLDALMGRGADLLDATGLVVWVANPDGTHLAPAAAHGYNAATLGHIGSIPLSGENITVAAFRNGTATRTAPEEGRPAVAVPLLSAAGTVGVVAAEVSRERDLDTATALATVMAAQIATLFQPPAAPSDGSADTTETTSASSEPAPRQAQA